jgi:HD-GYP domain-containing protein (c-di-GMP phosphodiesterase class II)
MLAEYSPDDWQHSGRVADQNVRVIDRVRVPGIGRKVIYRESLLHDIGKIKIDKKVLMKPGVLTMEERRLMKQHALYGAEMLEREGLDGSVTLHHHSYYGDGATNPEGFMAMICHYKLGF